MSRGEAGSELFGKTYAAATRKRVGAVAAKPEVARDKKGVKVIDVDLVDLSKNLRQDLDTEGDDFQALLASIKEIGLIEMPVINETLVEGSPAWECISGHRRITACKLLGQTQIPMRVHYDLSEEQIFIMRFDENSKREDFSAIDLIGAVRKAKDHYDMTMEQISNRLGRKDRKFAARLIKASAWPLEALSLIEGYNIPTTVIYRIASRELSDEEVILALREAAGLSPKTEKERSFRPKNKKRLEEYFEESKLTPAKKAIIMDFLEKMKIPGWCE